MITKINQLYTDGIDLFTMSLSSGQPEFHQLYNFEWENMGLEPYEYNYLVAGNSLTKIMMYDGKPVKCQFKVQMIDTSVCMAYTHWPR